MKRLALAEKSHDYQSYLLRLWSSREEGGPAWRASLEDTATGEMQGFEDLDSLFEELRERTARRDSGQEIG